MSDNPYDAPKLPSEPGRRFPWKRVFVTSAICAVSCTAIGKGIEVFLPDFRLQAPVVQLYVASGMGLLLSLFAMLASFVGWRSQSRAGRSDSGGSN
jgi:hypothetical protein